MYLGEIQPINAQAKQNGPNGSELVHDSGPNVDHSSGFSLATVLLGGSGLFVLATLFFGTKGGYYDTDDYDGNGTAH
jgi:hypothetical protein